MIFTETIRQRMSQNIHFTIFEIIFAEPIDVVQPWDPWPQLMKTFFNFSSLPTYGSLISFIQNFLSQNLKFFSDTRYLFNIIFLYHIKPWPSGDIGLNPTQIGRWFFHVSFGNKYFVWFTNWSVISLFSLTSGIFEVKSVKPVIRIRLFSKGERLKCKSPLFMSWKN